MPLMNLIKLILLQLHPVVNDTYSTNEDTALSTPPRAYWVNDTDADGTSLMAVSISNPSHGTLTLNSSASSSIPLFLVTPEPTPFSTRPATAWSTLIRLPSPLP
jgi:hypothetical protein